MKHVRSQFMLSFGYKMRRKNAMRKKAFITGITGFITGSIVGFFIFRWAIRKYIFNQIDIINTAEQADPVCPPQGAGSPEP